MTQTTVHTIVVVNSGDLRRVKAARLKCGQGKSLAVVTDNRKNEWSWLSTRRWCDNLSGCRSSQRRAHRRHLWRGQATVGIPHGLLLGAEDVPIGRMSLCRQEGPECECRGKESKQT